MNLVPYPVGKVFTVLIIVNGSRLSEISPVEYQLAEISITVDAVAQS